MARIIHQGEAITWLKNQPILTGCSLITSMPDISEFPEMNLQQWQDWFKGSASLIFEKTPPEGMAIFYQTDILRDGEWVDKSFLIQTAAAQHNVNLLMHKIICRVPPGETTFGKPAYSHLLAFSKSVKPEIAKSLPDVLADAGETTWTRGMGTEACLLACRLVIEHTVTRTIVDPFCGHGSVLAVANSLGLSAIGVELNARRARKARSLDLT